jgi:hypothetical protein
MDIIPLNSDKLFPDPLEVPPPKAPEKSGDREAHPGFDQKKKKLPPDAKGDKGKFFDEEA